MHLINQKLTDEVEALNAIYGEGTLCITRSKPDGLEMQFRLPAISPRDQLTFRLLFPYSYPDSRAPVYLYADVGLFESLDRRVQNISLTVASFLEEAFVPGTVCIFDLIDVMLGVISCMDEYTVDAERVEQFGPALSEYEWRWTNKKFINMNDCRERAECYICCDEDYSFRMVQVPCRHSYCFSCFQMGWDIASRESDVYTCCKKRVPLDLIRTCTNADKDQCESYERQLLERDTINPFFCGNPRCNTLIGSLSLWALSRGRVKTQGVFCKKCRFWTCAGCRLPRHAGICMDQKELIELFKRNDIRRCLVCGDAIEKNGGCRHMQCRTCKTHYWWEENGTLTKFTGINEDLNEG